MEPIRRERLHDVVSKQLALAILRGETEKWSSEIALCRELEVSRSVLRESIKVLASKGLIELRPRLGLRILPRSEWNLLDPELLIWQFEAGMAAQLLRNLCEFRLVVETTAAGLAAARATPEERASIQGYYRELKENAADKEAYNKADLSFHSAIFEASHNAFVKHMSGAIRTGLSAAQTVTSESTPDVGLPFHKNLADAICRRDALASRIASEKLILRADREIHEVLHPDSPDRWEPITCGACPLFLEKGILSSPV